MDRFNGNNLFFLNLYLKNKIPEVCVCFGLYIKRFFRYNDSKSNRSRKFEE